MRSPFSNSCDDVRRELSLPGQRGALVAQHLATCASCAAWAERDLALMRLWETTRPDEPTSVSWETLWARVTQGLDSMPASLSESQTEPAIVAFASSVRGRFAAGLFIAAQAAAILAAVGLWMIRHPSPMAPESWANASASTQIRTVALRGQVVIDPGELVVIREEGRALSSLPVVEVASDDRSDAVDAYFAMLNAFESMAD
jgi:hypothetical protein